MEVFGVVKDGKILSEYNDRSPLLGVGPGQVVRAGNIDPAPGVSEVRFIVVLSEEISKVTGVPRIVPTAEDGGLIRTREAAERVERAYLRRYLEALARQKTVDTNSAPCITPE